ncbi:MAG: ImuA family protein [Agriterribacter sp.]
MLQEKKDIIARLQREVLAMQGYKPGKGGYPVDMGLGTIAAAFPNQTFPLAAVHEFVTTSMEDAAATAGFITTLFSQLLQTGGVMAWISPQPLLFAPAFKQFGVSPERILFLHPKKKKDIGFVMEEALQCEALSAVIADWTDISFTESRRLQLAVEKSKLTGCIIRHSPRQLNTTACVSRWKISTLPSTPVDELPGIGFPTWRVELLKVRNGKPGSWIVEWAGDHLQQPAASGAVIRELARKTG